MKKIILSLFIMFVFIYTSPLFLTKNNGFYDPITGLMYCKTTNSCIHELGHWFDHNHHWISKTPAFITDVDIYSKSIMGLWLNQFLKSRGDVDLYQKLYFQIFKYEESYSILFQVYKSNPELIPDYLQKYFR